VSEGAPCPQRRCARGRERRAPRSIRSLLARRRAVERHPYARGCAAHGERKAAPAEAVRCTLLRSALPLLHNADDVRAATSLRHVRATEAAAVSDAATSGGAFQCLRRFPRRRRRGEVVQSVRGGRVGVESMQQLTGLREKRLKRRDNFLIGWDCCVTCHRQQ